MNDIEAGESISTLKGLKAGSSAIITSVGGEGALRQHFLDMGLIPGTLVTVVKYAPMGDPVEVKVRNYELTIRLEEADKITVTPIDHEIQDTKEDYSFNDLNKTEHPGFGEGGKYHKKEDELRALPAGTTMKFALVGNQNCGKTTLFNRLTGSNQHVGNFPGVTVDRKEGVIKGHPDTLVVDLPGIYSMSPYSSEEIVSRNFVLDEKPHAILNIVDVTNIERNLYLTMQLLEMDVPMVVALNMMDELSANGGTVDINKMEMALGVPVVAISAAKNEGIDELIDHVMHIAKYQEKPQRQDFCDENDHKGAVHRCIHSILHLIEDHSKAIDMPIRFAAAKIIEGDSLITERLSLDQNETETMEHIVIQMEHERGLDRSAAMADMRFSFIDKIVKAAVKKPSRSKERDRSEKIDKFLTGRFTAIPAFIAIMGLVFFLTFNVIGAFLQDLLEQGIDILAANTEVFLKRADVSEGLRRLFMDGIFAGVGGVLSFLPIIVTLFFFLSILEDSGYIARVAFVMDRILRKIGLSGRSIVPLLIGFGCTVPAVMSTRTLSSERDRKMTILLTPFMSCTAKLPIYAFFVNAYFPGKGGLIMTGLYVTGIVVAVLVSLLFRKTFFKGEAVPFVMELPNYRLPGATNVLKLLYDKAKDFLQRAFTVILVAAIVIWVLQSFDFSLKMTNDPSESILAFVAGLLSPVMEPIGLGDWRICTALISGFIAKESVVSTLQVLYPGDITAAISVSSTLSLLVFSLLYTPCVAAVAAIRRELGSKWAIALVVWQCILAWVLAAIVHLVMIML